MSTVLAFVCELENPHIEGYVNEGSYFVTGDVAEGLAHYSVDNSEDPENPYHKLNRAFFFRLMAYYWILSRHSGADLKFANDFLSSGHDEDVEVEVLDQLDSLTVDFHALDTLSSHVLKDLKRQFLAWFYTNLRYNSNVESNTSEH